PPPSRASPTSSSGAPRSAHLIAEAPTSRCDVREEPFGSAHLIPADRRETVTSRSRHGVPRGRRPDRGFSGISALTSSVLRAKSTSLRHPGPTEDPMTATIDAPSTARPQLELPGQVYAAGGPHDLSGMFVAHHGFRRDLYRFAMATRNTPVDDAQ